MQLKVPFVRNSILGTIDILYFIGKVCGMSPFTRFKNDQEEFVYVPDKLNWANFLPLFCLACIAPVLVYYGYYYDIHFKTKLDVGCILLWMICWGSALSIVGTTFMFMLRQEELVAAFNTLDEIDRTFRKLRIYFSCRLIHVGTIVAVLIYVSILLTNHFYCTEVKGKPQGKQLTETFIYIGGWGLRMWGVYYYLLVIFLVALRMHFLNRHIQTWNVYKMSKETLYKEFDIAMEIHFKIIYVSHCLNSVFSVPIVLNIVMTSLLMLTQVLAFCGYNSERQDEVILWFGTNLPVTWGIIILAAYSTYESKKLGQNISGIAIPMNDKETASKIYSMLLQITHMNVAYDAGGMFSLELGLITTHLNTMATLVMFLLSFKNEGSI